MNRLSQTFLVFVVLLLFAVNGSAILAFAADEQERSEEGSPHVASATAASETDDFHRLVKLWQTRSREKINNDYPVGPGDVVEIHVPPIEELRNTVVRISGDGTMSLPLIGKIEATGLTEEQLKQVLVERLKQYMYNPRLSLFVKEYHSRQVAVLGAVMRPGLYGLTSGADTLLDMISIAGGFAPGADPKLYLIPAEGIGGGRAKEMVSTVPARFLSQDTAPLSLKRAEPILIDMRQVALGGNQQYLSFSVRPGDVILVPGGGQVLVEGWVEKPGAYNMSSGLTVAGIVAASGGPLFPADVTAVKILRADRAGTKKEIVVDLDKIKRGESPDIGLEGGDMVQVPSDTAKLVPWGLYRFFTAIVNIGVHSQVPIK